MKNTFAYYKSKYGPPERKAIVVTHGGERIEVCKWNAQATANGYTLYTTLGASERIGDQQSGCEFFITLKPDADDIAKALAETATDGNGTRAIPVSGDTITLGYPLWRGTQAHSFLFLRGGDLLPPDVQPDKEVIFIRLVPLFESEQQYSKKHGAEDLLQRFAQEGVDYSDCMRKQAF